MKKMKKLIAVILAAVMVLALAIPAMATDVNNSTPDTSITITPKDNGDHTFTAYQIFGGELSASGVLSNVVWANGVKGDTVLTSLKSDQNLGTLFNNCSTAANVAEVLDTIANDKNTSAAFASFMASQEANLGTGNQLSKNDNGQYTISGIPVGYYLITDSLAEGTTGAKVSEMILQVVGKVTIDAKADIPQVTKKADADSYSINDEIGYTLTATVPDFVLNETEAYQLTFTDTMSSALDLIYTYQAHAEEVQTGVEVKMGDSDVTGKFQITYKEHILTVSCADISNIDGISADSIFTVTYKAKINDTYVSGAVDNRVTLVTKDYTSTDIEENVFPVTLQIKKVSGDDSEPLKGAEFKLSRQNDNVTEYLQISNGKVNSWITDIDQASTLTTDESGTISVAGLALGEYTLAETKAPDGYNLPSGNFILEIKADVNQAGDALEGLNIVVNNGQPSQSADNETVIATIENNKGAQLPSTGGIGTTIFYVIGAIIVVGAAVILITRRRMNAGR